MFTSLRALFARWRASRRPVGYIPSQRELKRDHARRLLAIARRLDRAGASSMADYMPHHAAEYGGALAIPAAVLTRRLRRERLARLVAVQLAPRHGTRRAPSRRLGVHLPRLAARQAVPVRDTARALGTLHRQARAAVGDILAGRAERVIRRHYAPGSWGWDGHTEEVWAVA